MKLRDKVVVVTGATGGIGVKLCEELDKKGSKLILISKDDDKLKKLAKSLKHAQFIAFDFTHLANYEDLEKAIRVKCDQVDILINNAGIGIYKTIEEADFHDWNESLSINATFPFLLIKSLLPILKISEKALILNVGTGMGKIPTGGRSLYCASKAALRLLSMSLSKEYQGTNIHFVHVALGSTLTGFGPLTLKEKQEENLKGKAYFTADWVAEKFVEIIEMEDFEDEIELYPSQYTGKNWNIK
ncbi:hypothetical protein A3D01_05015 [Candidatus Woesebacteria bacterium RIFCSPHIGHO2_02_FULL_39_13]|uniref:Short-chain dehydrogenase n=1 Tax=Candidatus Woesebacteria bacterium RIFCSPHIGHO2_02_FULL_39_13 TaxID=1802505 RepID=A0A1F7Z041_9BACT|nr:MAG: hypothetical protein A2692_00335 [Candidatus Woesebacteria bacterium RIFCSPHIGHO2_01_FULL_39_95]OGM32907.1 MAG: hypothetical protein A3D01_05015 [Candidatus Woesebacteria bacterium RIFCSPHIGHO2_02_FULL_39_13]OGM74420.1 MAG: hypothetical protein A3H19_05325 [Candidatus Woesebacteria bacterium RIFCSPLOWO2_12_FULL_39_9]